MYWLGIDVGTGGTRALLVDRQGKMRHAVTAPHEDIRMERPLWAEQHPDNWWDATCKAVGLLLSQTSIAGKEIRAVGLSGQMHGLVMLDSSDRVVRPGVDLVRSAKPEPGGCRQSDRGQGSRPFAYRQSCSHRLHLTETPLGLSSSLTHKQAQWRFTILAEGRNLCTTLPNKGQQPPVVGDPSQADPRP